MSTPVPSTRSPRRSHAAGRTRRSRLVALAVIAVLAVAGLGAWLVTRGNGGPSPVAGTPVTDSGAVGDGETDDTLALQAAFDSAAPDSTVVLPAGRTFAHSGVLTIRTPGLTVTGGGTLLATNEETSSLTVAADRVTVSDLTLNIAGTTRRWDAYEQQRLRLDGHTGITLRDVTVHGSAAAGVYVGGGTSNFLLDHVQVSDTRADGIHITQGAHDGRVVAPQVSDVGDDGVAVVSYAPDGDPCARISVESPVVDGSSGGRGISVVGGTDITYSDIDVSNTYAAGVYIAAEGSYDTTGVTGVRVTGGTVTDANTGTDIDHGAVLVYNGTTDRPITDVQLSDLQLVDTRDTASRWVGLVSDSTGPITDVTLDGFSLDGDGPDETLVSNQDATTYSARGWTRDGEELPDQPSAAAEPTETPASSSSAGPTAAPASTAGTSVLDLGAVGDGVTDDTAALQTAFDDAAPGSTLVLPAGHTFVQDAVLTLSSPGVTLAGGGTLLATDEQASSLTLAADDVTLTDVTLAIAGTTRRRVGCEQQRLRLDGHTGITVRNVRVIGSAAAGMYIGGGTSDFLIDHVQVQGTRADGIHMTQGAHDGTVVAPLVQDVGDDGVAVVSYAQDGDPCARIQVQSPVVAGSSGGRGVSVVGGQDITYTDIDVSDTYAAGVYIAAEGSFDSAGVQGVRIDGGTVSDANDDTSIDHGAVLVYNGTSDRTVDDVEMSDLTLTGTRASASRWVGLVSDGPGRISDVDLDGFSIAGGGPQTAFVSNQDATTFQTSGWQLGGRAVPDQDNG